MRSDNLIFQKVIRFFQLGCEASTAKTAKIRVANSSASPMDTWTAEWLATQRILFSLNTQQKTRFLLMTI
jgi:hypothetical protein